MNLLDILEQSDAIGTAKIRKDMIVSINSTLDKITTKYYYVPSKGVFYTITDDSAMSFMIKGAKSADIKIGDGKDIYLLNTSSISNIIKGIKSKYVYLDVYDGYVKVRDKVSSKVTKIEKVNNKVKFITSRMLLNKKDYTKVPVSPDNLTKAIDWIYNVKDLSHPSAFIELKDGTLVMHDENYVGKNNKKVFDIAKAVLAKTTLQDSFKVKLNLAYVNILNSFLKSIKFADVIYLEVIVIDSEYPVVFKGYLEYYEKDMVNKDKIQRKFNYEVIIAPSVEV